MAILKLPLKLLIVIPCFLLASCAGSKEVTQPDEFTEEFRSFLAIHETEVSEAIIDSVDGYRFMLENGRLCIIGTDSSEIWSSNDEWYVDSFKTGDVNCDRILDVVFTVWKSYSFGDKHPARMDNDDASVKCHLFVYSVKDNRVKSVWCSSNLPRPIYSFELNSDGKQTPTLSGVRLAALEGAYTEDYSKTTPAEYIYEWNSWGFSPVAEPENITL